MNIAFNWLDKFQVQTAPGNPVVDYAGSTGFDGSTGAQFKWKLFATFGYSLGPADLSLRWRHLPSVKNAARVTNPAATVQDTASYDIFDLAGGFKIADGYSLRAGVDNLFDKQPPIVGRNPGVTSGTGFTDAGVYDVLGRRFFVGLKAKF